MTTLEKLRKKRKEAVDAAKNFFGRMAGLPAVCISRQVSGKAFSPTQFYGLQARGVFPKAWEGREERLAVKKSKRPIL